MFALADVASFKSLNLKCDPERSAELRERYDAVEPGYHMNKKHWITVILDGSIPDGQLQGWIDDSYDLVVLKLSKSDKLALNSV